MLLPISKFLAPVLYKKCEEVEVFDKELTKLVMDMKDTMIKNGGIGLAAPQVGVSKRVIIVTSVTNKDIMAVINPVITWQGCQNEKGQEGCLSFPGKSKSMWRPTMIEVEGYNLSGQKVQFKVEGFQARIFCHEIDHLNGICRVGGK